MDDAEDTAPVRVHQDHHHLYSHVLLTRIRTAWNERWLKTRAAVWTSERWRDGARRLRKERGLGHGWTGTQNANRDAFTRPSGASHRTYCSYWNRVVCKSMSTHVTAYRKTLSAWWESVLAPERLFVRRWFTPKVQVHGCVAASLIPLFSSFTFHCFLPLQSKVGYIFLFFLIHFYPAPIARPPFTKCALLHSLKSCINGTASCLTFLTVYPSFCCSPFVLLQLLLRIFFSCNRGLQLTILFIVSINRLAVLFMKYIKCSFW